MVRNVDWQWGDDERGSEAAALRRPCDLLPWADPYIAMLIASLEREQLSAEED